MPVCIDSFKRMGPEAIELLRSTTHTDRAIAEDAQLAIATTLNEPLQQGVLHGNIVADIFTEVEFAPGVAPEWPIDFIAPGTEGSLKAVTVPNHGAIPQFAIEGDYVMVPTFDTGAAIDWNIKYSRDARWDIVARALQVLEAMFTKKKNDDAFRTLLAAAVSRNVIGYDDQATAGLFTKRGVSILKTFFRRNGGGNSADPNGRSRLTDLCLSPEGLEDVRSWDLTQVDDVTRREIFLAGEEGGLNKVFNVKLHDLDEFGASQEYQNYVVNTLGLSIPGSKLEMALGLDLINRDSFVHPIREKVKIEPEEYQKRARRAGFYAYQESGYGILDNRRVGIMCF